MAPAELTTAPHDASGGPRLVVGLEVHVRLATPTKLFCRCPNRYGDPPNTLTCPVCLGLPGALPVCRPEAVVLGTRLALALDARIPTASEFVRKNYGYPDLPRNYQITQVDRPLATGGRLTVDDHTVRLRRLHLEEDAGRSLHTAGGSSRVDLNRAGTPLLEIVTEPDLPSGAAARRWLQELRRLVVYLEVGDGEMAQGSLRCDANVGLAADGSRAPTPGALSELKNLNSFRAVAQAVDHEMARLTRRLAEGRPPRRETRRWDERAGRTCSLRSKETSADYRYFPEPDLPPLNLEPGWIDACRRELPELPHAVRHRWIERYGLRPDEAEVLAGTRPLAEYLDRTTVLLCEHADADEAAAGRLAAAWIRTELLAVVPAARTRIQPLPLSPQRLAGLLALILDGTLTTSAAKSVLAVMLTDADATAAAVVASRGLGRVEAAADIDRWCDEVLSAHAAQIADYRAGRIGVLEFLIGQVMRRSAGRADPERVRSRLRARLGSPAEDGRRERGT